MSPHPDPFHEFLRDTRLAVRAHIETSMNKLGLLLEEHTIHQVINDYMRSIAEELATGKPLDPVEWDSIVQAAYDEQGE